MRSFWKIVYQTSLQLLDIWVWHNINSYDATHLSTLQVVSGPLLIYNFPCPCFLQLIWFWAHRLELGLNLREDWPIYGCIIGRNGRRVIAGLAACGAMTTIVSTAADLMQDFKTGYLTLTSAKSMFVCQVYVCESVGTAMGCIIAPRHILVILDCFWNWESR